MPLKKKLFKIDYLFKKILILLVMSQIRSEYFGKASDHT